MFENHFKLCKIDWSTIDLYNGIDLEAALQSSYISVFNVMNTLRPQVTNN